MYSKHVWTSATLTMPSLHPLLSLQKFGPPVLLLVYKTQSIYWWDIIQRPSATPMNITATMEAPLGLKISINPLSFPLSKQEAAERPHVAQNAFLQIIASFPPSSLVAYTDGSLITDSSCSCAVFIKGYTGIAEKTCSWVKHLLSWARRDTTSARIFP